MYLYLRNWALFRFNICMDRAFPSFRQQSRLFVINIANKTVWKRTIRLSSMVSSNNSLSRLGGNSLNFTRCSSHPSLYHSLSFLATLQILIIYMHHRHSFSLIIWHPSNHYSSILRLIYHQNHLSTRIGTAIEWPITVPILNVYGSDVKQLTD